VLRSPEATVYNDPYIADGDPPNIVRMIPVPLGLADATRVTPSSSPTNIGH
jgi:L-ascorbate 6-phosphate lactonase